jgi:hypothetical protein
VATVFLTSGDSNAKDPVHYAAIGAIACVVAGDGVVAPLIGPDGKRWTASAWPLSGVNR